MKAMVYTPFGDNDILHFSEVDKPVPADDDVLIRVKATTVTKSHFRPQSPKLLRLPSRLALGAILPKQEILGTEFAGVVEAVGKNVRLFKPNDRVFGLAGVESGTYAEYITVQDDGVLSLMPVNTNFEEAASIPYGALIALQMLRDKAKVQVGQKVLINGASGPVGSAAVQIAKWLGAKVTGICSTDELTFVKALGADRVVDHSIHDFTVVERQYDVVFDIANTACFDSCCEVLKPRGICLKLEAGLAEYYQMMSSIFMGKPRLAFRYRVNTSVDLVLLKDLMEMGILKPRIDRQYAFSQLEEAHQYAHAKRRKGSVVIQVS
ncbi:NAD(P)-dependent alcohol dehydrogenase [Vibrio sp. S9_S30]|uniref:NAD(P)-dependent alcohol dehydrogenase n=1 Tax=Vibrio sp. S9_S30 TaxID=2720226 RepID=UPI0016813BC1|nr:NAD(P)-dependent alcohol dehydrogenase [Vibrio sp. S9_S30]MBD1557588.1 NAD(P)-dependent alcohol dehydrogenase [Vibrio sp. S9_S30]